MQKKKGMRIIEKVKCKKCKQTLLFAEHIKGEIKCPRCGEINQIEIRNKGKSQQATP